MAASPVAGETARPCFSAAAANAAAAKGPLHTPDSLIKRIRRVVRFFSLPSVCVESILTRKAGLTTVDETSNEGSCSCVDWLEIVLLRVGVLKVVLLVDLQ